MNLQKYDAVHESSRQRKFNTSGIKEAEPVVDYCSNGIGITM